MAIPYGQRNFCVIAVAKINGAYNYMAWHGNLLNWYVRTWTLCPASYICIGYWYIACDKYSPLVSVDKTHSGLPVVHILFNNLERFLPSTLPGSEDVPRESSKVYSIQVGDMNVTRQPSQALEQNPLSITFTFEEVSVYIWAKKIERWSLLRRLLCCWECLQERLSPYSSGNDLLHVTCMHALISSLKMQLDCTPVPFGTSPKRKFHSIAMKSSHIITFNSHFIGKVILVVYFGGVHAWYAQLLVTIINLAK